MHGAGTPLDVHRSCSIQTSDWHCSFAIRIALGWVGTLLHVHAHGLIGIAASPSGKAEPCTGLGGDSTGRTRIVPHPPKGGQFIWTRTLYVCFFLATHILCCSPTCPINVNYYYYHDYNDHYLGVWIQGWCSDLSWHNMGIYPGQSLPLLWHDVVSEKEAHDWPGHT